MRYRVQPPVDLADEPKIRELDSGDPERKVKFEDDPQEGQESTEASEPNTEGVRKRVKETDKEQS